MDSVNFKALASGEPIEARLPYGEPFMLKNYARLIFNTNELPREIEHNDAFLGAF
jgi:putative DNA primase/helicase